MHLSPTAPHPGIGLKPQHFDELLAMVAGVHTAASPAIPGWVEIHPQNYFREGGPMRAALREIAEHLPVSFHSVGLSLGSVDGPNLSDLEAIAALAQDVAPVRISDHLSWSGNAHDQLPDLLPLPYTAEALELVCRNIEIVQERLGRKILVENPSRVLAFAADTMDEATFFHALAARTGCGLLLDINNILVSATNLGADAEAWMNAMPLSLAQEVHLAGHATEWHADGPLLIDDHGSAVGEKCWALYARFCARAGAVPTLIEWDTDVPALPVLLAEAARAAQIMNRKSFAAGLAA